MTLPAGARLDRYEIRSLLGSGGMGDVYLARDPTLNRDIALKLLPARFASDADRLRRFTQEARSASALNHPAIVAIYELGQADGQPYISMELVDGQTVRQLLIRGAIPPRRALHVAAQIADALAKAHEAGLVHRDLKPENLMVSADGFAKILDFGLAKLVDRSADQASLPTVTSDATRAGSVLGTVGYMSPEQASGQPADVRSDQFSFGLVLYEMLTGRRAFVRATAAETLSAIIREEPPPFDQANSAVPTPVRWIVERCLAKAPDERYASTRDLARDLASARDHYSELTTASSAVAPRRALRRREVIAWATAAVLGAAALGLALRYGARATPESARPIRLTIEPPAGATFHLTVGATPFALSPDGRHLAFVARVADGGRQLWLRAFDSLESRPLTGTGGAAGPFWSPDGLSIAFFAGGKLKRISASGGDVVTICDARGGGGGGAWNREDVIVFAPGVESGLSRVPAGGGTPTPVTALDPAHDEAAHTSPIFLPDGRHFVFEVLGRDNNGVYVGTLDASERKMLMANRSSIAFSESDGVFFLRDRDRALLAQRVDLERLAIVGDPVLVAEGVAIAGPTAAMAVSANGTLVYWSGDQNVTQLNWMRRDGTKVGTVGPPGGYMNIALSADGRQVAVDRFDTQPSIWVIDVARGAATRATFGGLYESTPVWAPDGKAFVFAAARDTPPNVYLKRLDVTADEQRLFHSTIQCFPQSWSHDGQTIAYVTIDPKTRHDVWLLPTSGGGKPWPVLHTPFRETHPRISPDGRWLAYASGETGRTEVYVTRFPVPAGKWPVSTAGGSFPAWRVDSRELYYRADDGKLMAVSVGAGSDFDAGVPAALFTPDATPGTLGLGTFYDVAADGRFLVNLNVEHRSPPATVVLKWSPAAARR